MTTKEALHRLIEDLPESALDRAWKLLEGLRQADLGRLPRILADAPWDDEPETAEDRAAIQEAYESLERGDLYTLEQMRRELGL